MNWPKTCNQSIKVNFPHRIFLGSEYVITLPKSGDMITSVRLVLNLPTVNTLQEQIINKAEFLVGDNILESISGDFLQILNDYGTTLEKRQTYQTNLNGPLVTLDIPFSILKPGFHMVTVPSVRISLTRGITLAEINGYLLVDYSLIEDPTKSTFIQRVTQNQNIRGIFNGATLVKFDTAFVGPVYNLFFTAKVSGEFVDYIQNVKLATDGQERFNLGKQYLKYVEPLKTFKCIATQPVPFYSFCLDPANSSGSMNFSRIDTQRFDIQLLENTDQVQVDIWAQSHNFVYFNSSNVLPIFETRELILSSSQDQTLSVLQDLPVTVAYRFYLNSISIFYYTEFDITVTPLVVSIYPDNPSIVYSSGVITINNIFTDTYITLSFSAPGYNTVSCAISVNLPLSSSAYSLAPISTRSPSYSQVDGINIKTDQTMNIYEDGGGNLTQVNYNTSAVINLAPTKGFYLNLADSFGMKNLVTSTIIDYDDSTFVAMMSNRNVYNSDLSVYGIRPQGGCIVKYDTNSNVQWLTNLPGTNPLLGYLYPTLYGANQVQKFTSGDANIIKVSSNYSMTLLLDNNGIVYYGGSNNYGEAGRNNTVNPCLMGFYVPESFVGTDLIFVDISCGQNHAALVDSNGGLWTTGLNSSGQLGLGDNTDRSEYNLVYFISEIITKVSCGSNHTVALDSNGGFWVTGLNSSGQLGLGDNTNRNTFTLVSFPEQVQKISAGWNNTAVIIGAVDKILYVTGDNSSGQLGTGNTTNMNTFKIVGFNYADVSCGYKCLMAIGDSSANPMVDSYVNTGITPQYGSCIDASGNIFITNSNNTITKISSSGLVTLGYVSSGLNAPNAICTDSAGKLFVTNGSGTITKIEFQTDFNYANLGVFSGPMCIDSLGNLFIASITTNSIIKVSSTGVVTFGYVSVINPFAICVDSSRNLFILRSNRTITKVSPDGTVVTPNYYTGIPNNTQQICIDSSDNIFLTGGNLTVTKISSTGVFTFGYVTGLPPNPSGICADTSGNLFITNYDNTITKVSSSATVTPNYANNIPLSTPIGIYSDPSGNLYVLNQGNNTVTKISSTLVATYEYISGLSDPRSVVIDTSGRLYINNGGDSTIKRYTFSIVVTPDYALGLTNPTGICVDTTGNLFVTRNSTIAKVSVGGFVNFSYVTTNLSSPSAICIDTSNNLFVTNNNNVITKVSSSGTITPIYTSLTGPIFTPSGICVNTSGNLYVLNQGNNTVTKISSSGTVVTPNYISTGIMYPTAICVDTVGNLFITNVSNTVTKAMNPSAVIMAGGVWPTYNFTFINPIFAFTPSSIKCSKGPQADYYSTYSSTNFIIDTTGSLWVQGIANSGQAGTPSSSSTFTNVLTGIYDPGVNATTTVTLPTIVNVSIGVGYSVAVDANGAIWVCGITLDSDPQSGLSAMGKHIGHNKFEYNKVFKQSTTRSDTINFFTINRQTGSIGNSVNIAGMGTLTNIKNDSNGRFYVDTIQIVSNTPHAYSYNLDSTFSITGFNGPFGTKCYSYIDRFDNYYLAYVDSNSSTTTLKYKSWTISVSNSPCQNCLVEVDFLNNIYFVGDYSGFSYISGGTNPTWSTNGGTFIMKINQAGVIKWIIQIKNYSLNNFTTTIRNIIANQSTGTMCISGYINSTMSGSVTVQVTGPTSPAYTISVSGANSTFISNAKYGFEFIFDPSGNLNPQEVIVVPSVDFFQVPYENLIGLHPVSTLPIPAFYPPNYIRSPPVSLVNFTYTLSPDNLTSTSYLSNKSSGNGTYIVKTSSVNSYNIDVTSIVGIKAFDNALYTYWESEQTYDYFTGYFDNVNNPTRYLNTTSGALYGEYISIQIPSPVKASYVTINEDTEHYALQYTFLGSNDGTLWIPILSVTGSITVSIKLLSSLTYTVSDASKLYPGMTTGSLKIVSVDHLAYTIVLSGIYVGSSTVTFSQVPNKTLYLNSQTSYLYYVYSVQQIPINLYALWVIIKEIAYYEYQGPAIRGSARGTGGTITTSGPYTIHTFLVGGYTFTISGGLLTCDILIVAGGGAGGGGGGRAGGGGAGGLVYVTSANLIPGDYSVTVGTGGAGGTLVGGNGTNSSFNSYVAFGGGGGSASTLAGSNGGSGGGSGGLGGALAGIASPPGQGNNGGNGAGQKSTGAGGGGGAGGVGEAAILTIPGPGGIGKQYDISGTLTYYAGGGGGGATGSTLGANGGLGGGGYGFRVSSAQAGTDGLGGGGGGGGTGGNGGGGGSGIVIVRYLT